MINKITRSFACACMIAASLTTLTALQAIERLPEGEDFSESNNKREISPQEIIKKRRVYLENYPTPPNDQDPLLLLPDELVCNIVTFLPLPDALKLEQVCKQLSHSLEESPLYRSIIESWNMPIPEGLKDQCARAVLLELIKTNFEFQVHLADLWRNYFPLGLRSSELPLTHYWETHIKLLGSSLSEKLNSIYKNYLADHPSTEKSTEYHQRADLGAIITEESIPNRYLGLTKLLTQQNYPHEIVDQACVEIAFLSINTVKGFLNNRIRSNLTRVLRNPSADPKIKANAQLIMAEMDYLGEDIQQPDYAKARINYQAGIDNPAASPDRKASAQFFMGEMDRRGQGLHQPDYAQERNKYQAALDNPAIPDSIKAFVLSTMKKRDQELAQPDYANARINYQAVIDNPAASLDRKADAQFLMGRMDQMGEGLQQPDYAKARINYQAVIDNPAASSDRKATAQFLMGQMDQMGEGLPQPDYANARINYQTVIDNPAASLDRKANAQFRMGQMDRLGQGLQQPDYAKARTNYQAVIDNPAASPDHKAGAQSSIGEMDRLGQGLPQLEAPTC